MLLPYNVERPAKRVPVCTYTLIGLNVFVYLITILIANVQLAGDRTQYHQQLKDLVNLQLYQAQQETTSSTGADPSAVSPDTSNAPQASPSTEPQALQRLAMPNFALQNFAAQQLASSGALRYNGFGYNGFGYNGFGYNGLKHRALGELGSHEQLSDTPSGDNSNNADASGADTYSDSSTRIAKPTAETEELERSVDGLEHNGKLTKDESVEARTFEWDAEHDRDLFVLEPHPTTLAWLGYWVGAPSLLGFFASMFLHGSLDHILGNMLFLWGFWARPGRRTGTSHLFAGVFRVRRRRGHYLSHSHHTVFARPGNDTGVWR